MCSKLPLEDVLPWEDFALRLPQYMLYRLPEALELIAKDPVKVSSGWSSEMPPSSNFSYSGPSFLERSSSLFPQMRLCVTVLSILCWRVCPWGMLAVQRRRCIISKDAVIDAS